MVVSVRPTDTTPVYRIQPTMHGGGAKKVIAVVAAVAIPIAAPAIASSIAASGVLGAAVSAAASTTVGAVAGSAIVGAGLGAITAKVTGGNVKAGAITGALGGAIGGYGVARSTGAGLGNVNQTGIQATANRTLGTNFGQPAGGNTLAQGAQGTSGTLGDQATANIGPGGGDAGATLSSTAPGTETLVSDPNAVTLQNASFTQGGADAGARLSNAGAGAGTGAQVAAKQTALSQLGPNATITDKFVATVKDSGSALVGKFTDPEALASVTMQAGGQLLGQALAPDPDMSPEQRELIEMRKAELADLKNRDEAAFNAQMDAAKQYLQQAQQYDPTYMAFQAANKEAIDQQRKLREQYRRAALGRGRDISEAERRRMSLDSARNVSSEYDRGFQQGQNLQNTATRAGLSAIPNAASFANYTTALSNLQRETQDIEAANRARSAGAAKNISDLFANFNTRTGTGYAAQQASQQTGLPDGINKKGGLTVPGEDDDDKSPFKPFYESGQSYAV